MIKLGVRRDLPNKDRVVLFLDIDNQFNSNHPGTTMCVFLALWERTQR